MMVFSVIEITKVTFNHRFQGPIPDQTEPSIFEGNREDCSSPPETKMDVAYDRDRLVLPKPLSS